MSIELWSKILCPRNRCKHVKAQTNASNAFQKQKKQIWETSATLLLVLIRLTSTKNFYKNAVAEKRRGKTPSQKAHSG